MAQNVYNGKHMRIFQWTNGGTAVSAGAIVVVGATEDATLAVALDDIGNGASGMVGVDCGVTVDKVSAAVFKQGESLIWDSSVGKFDDNQATPASGDVSGSCIADADGANTETSCSVWLTGIPGTLTA